MKTRIALGVLGAVLGLCPWLTPVQAQTITCNQNGVLRTIPGNLCSKGPIRFSGTCGESPYGESDVVFEQAPWETRVITIIEVQFALIVSDPNGAATLAGFMGDSTNPDPLTGEQWAQMNNGYYAQLTVDHQFPSGVGMTLTTEPGAHIDVHDECTPGDPVQGSFTVWYR